MKTLSINEMEMVNGGLPKWLTCGAAIAGAGLFIAGLTVTSGPIGLYAANALLGPTLVGTGIVGGC